MSPGPVQNEDIESEGKYVGQSRVQIPKSDRAVRLVKAQESGSMQGYSIGKVKTGARSRRCKARAVHVQSSHICVSRLKQNHVVRLNDALPIWMASSRRSGVASSVLLDWRSR